MNPRPFLACAILLASCGIPALAASAPRAGAFAAQAPSLVSLARKPAKSTGLRDVHPQALVAAIRIYPWSEGASFPLYASPGEVSDVALQPGEALVSVASGDTVRWIIGDTTSGSGAARRTHVLVKPAASGLRTNLIIATDRRVYHVEARSTVGTAMTGISWIYPEDALLALRRSEGSAQEAVAADFAVEHLNFNYRIEGDDPPWRPQRVFDDGRQIFIEFPLSLAQGEAPPLFVTGPDGRAELVNYRQRGHYYVVDRLFAAAELRLGAKRQQVVRIIRSGADRRGRRGR